MTEGRSGAARIVGWAVARRARADGLTPGPGVGRLYWVGQDGQVHDLGAFTGRGLVTLAWAHRLAYRQARARDERSRLASARGEADRLGALGSRLEAEALANTISELDAQK